VASPAARFGGLIVITGPEAFLAERAMADAVAALRQVEPDASVTTTAAADLDLGRFQAVTGADLFAACTIACLTGIEQTPADLHGPLCDLAADPPDSLALICQHGGGNQGKALLDKLRPLADRVVECPTLRPRQLSDFVRAEARRLGGSIGEQASQQLIDAIGSDSRALAAAVSQLLADAEQSTITVAEIRRYFAGRAAVSSFAVADDALAGRTGQAIVKLRWALGSGTAHVLVTAAFANALRQLGRYFDAAREHNRSGDIAAAIGAPTWKVDEIAQRARSWNEAAVARAIRATAEADAKVKGASGDPDFALEQLVLAVTACRRAAQRR
jgi:DNA polymerase-3 subunit delta